MDELERRWSERQDALRALLTMHGAMGCDFRVDLRRGVFFWQHETTGKPIVVAGARALASYALSDRSVLCSWANRSLPDRARVPRVGSIADRVVTDEAGAWRIAMEIGDACGAHFLYRAPNAQLWIFLGLWDVRAAGPDEAPFEPGSPWPYALQVIEMLLASENERADAELRVLLRNYGRTFVESHVHRGTKAEQALREIGERMIAVADEHAIERARVLAELADRVSAMQSS
jgi:hypothetical protein